MESLNETLEVKNGLVREVGDGYIVDEDDKEKGISLFVDVYGSSECQKLACVNGSDFENPRSKFSEYESSIIGMMLNGTLNREEKPTSSVMHVEFSLGNLVWVKNSWNTWWPGLIFNPSSSDSAENSEFSNALLVKYFGTNRMVWCDSSHLKLFVENFDEISKMNNSKMFSNSVDKAVIELSRRLEHEMVCSCKRVSENDDNHTHSIISKLQPELFLSFLKGFALDCFKPGFLEITSVENLLASFYRSKVHSQTTEENLIAVNAGRGHESRERRRSKYLSAPYTDSNVSSSKREGKKSDKKQDSSVEILSNLRRAAGTGHSVSSEEYLSGFRTWAFCEKSISDLQVMETSLDIDNGPDLSGSVKKETEMIDVKKGKEEEIPIIRYKKKKGTKEEIPIITFKKKNTRKKKEVSMAIPDLPGSMENDIQGSSDKKKQRKETETEKPAINPALASGSSEMSIVHQTKSVKKSEERIEKRKRTIAGFVEASISTGNVNENSNSSSKSRDFSSLKSYIAICRNQQDIEQSESQPEEKKASEETKKKQKKKKKPTLSGMNLTYKKLEPGEEESIGSALVLKFDQEHPPLPSKETLLENFSKFGNIKESETDVFIESHTAQVVFLNGSEAANAFRSLENKGPFGQSLITFRLIHLSDPPKVDYTRPPLPSISLPSSSLPIPMVSSEFFMRKTEPEKQNGNRTMMRNNLEMMTKVMEEKGNTISPELRLKLENDIKSLMTRLRSMDGSSSSTK